MNGNELPTLGATDGRSAESARTTLAELFPGNMGRVALTRVAIRLRSPELLQMPTGHPLDPDLLTRVLQAVADVKRG